MKKDHPKKKGRKLNLILCAASFVIMLAFLFFIDKPDKLFNALKNVQPLFLVLCVASMFAYWLCETATVHVILKPLCPAARLRDTWYDTIIGQYFNCITPFASGGQPMQAYYFTEFGVPLGNALTALLSRFIVYQFVLTAYSAATLAAGFRTEGKILIEGGLMPFVLIGFAINTGVIIFLLGIALWRKGTEKAVNGIITLLNKMRIIKKPMKQRLYYTREVRKFHNNFQFIKKNVGVILKAVLFTSIQLLLYLNISYFLYRGFFQNADMLWGRIITYQAYVNMFSSFMPLPGAMGAAELGYAGFFNKIFGEFTGAATLLWRIFTFYLPIIVGIIHLLTLKRRGFVLPDKVDLNEIKRQGSAK
ncbi:MAG: flippase-like domain-containing protein [Oscillospiraceae bacterium]|nr:flippase-like domain-containing protein [Oscillospiraceae bacterium]